MGTFDTLAGLGGMELTRRPLLSLGEGEDKSTDKAIKNYGDQPPTTKLGDPNSRYRPKPDPKYGEPTLKDSDKTISLVFDSGTRAFILGDLSVQGNIKPLRSLTEPLQVAKDNGAKRALIPIENKRSFLDVSADIMEHVDPIFFGDPKTAAMKVLGLA